MKHIIKVFFFLTMLFQHAAYADSLLKVAVAGLNHDHVYLLLNLYKEKKVEIIGIAEANSILVDKIQAQYNLPKSVFYADLGALLKKVKPEVVLAYNPTNEHIQVAEICLPRKIPVMVEKPMATTLADAKRIATLSRENKTPFFVNYETTWYKSNQQLKQLLEQNAVGTVTRMIVKDGHEGPKEIGCSSYFLDWLTDPQKNGGGALMDFGCYGANLMTWIKNGERPISVSAITHQLKPEIYPKVEDDATIILKYRDGSTGIIQASWAWPYSVKDLQVFGTKAQLYAQNDKRLVEYTQHNEKPTAIPTDQPYFENHIQYLEQVLSGNQQSEADLGSISNNVTVVEILEAAKRSAKEGKTIVLN
ncbi:Gfo/Idh/MocA family protein [Sphingobacterium prati]|uniref:Gfo/Idh/MocA family protein n=1 Tax=Sphingobacterium prati TaxID=2737006 RepID=UPI001551FEB6|nr:Gfo/Idh/MocA family oxidoreductase [Sphingobacterium prati]NPE46476.1 Gfo/Idh/MocA family oxidoreductase [Sphingobacterium prati]